MDLIAAGPEASAGGQAGRHLRAPRRADVGRGSHAAANRRARGPRRTTPARWPSRSSAAAARKLPIPAPQADADAGAETAAAVGDAPPRPGLFQRPGRLQPRRARVRHHPRPRADDARAVGQRDRQSLVRHGRLRERQRLHLVRKTAHEFRLTPWYNDPVTDTSGEAIYVRDEETGQFWSPSPLPARGHNPYVSPPRLRLQHLRARRGRHRHRAVRFTSPPTRRSSSPVLKVAQPLRPAAPALRHRLLGVGAGRTAAANRSCTW